MEVISSCEMEECSPVTEIKTESSDSLLEQQYMEPTPKRTPAFVRHLWDAVSDPTTDNVISWDEPSDSNEDGQTFTIRMTIFINTINSFKIIVNFFFFFLELFILSFLS